MLALEVGNGMTTEATTHDPLERPRGSDNSDGANQPSIEKELFPVTRTEADSFRTSWAAMTRIAVAGNDHNHPLQPMTIDGLGQWATNLSPGTDFHLTGGSDATPPPPPVGLIGEPLIGGQARNVESSPLQRSLSSGEASAASATRLLNGLPEARLAELRQLRHELTTAASTAERQRLQERVRVLVGPEFIRNYVQAHTSLAAAETQSTTRTPTAQNPSPRRLPTAEEQDRITGMRERLSPLSDLSFLRHLPPGDTSRLVDRRANVSDAFMRQVDQALEAIPIATRNALAAAGYRVVVGENLTAILPHLQGQTPRGWPPGSSWNQTDGAQDQDRRIVAIGARRLQAGPGGRSVWVDNDRAGGVVRHEVGHALNVALGGGRGQLFSNSAEFQADYDRDLRDMTQAHRQQLAYLLQPGAGGRDETFAEVTASLFGGSTNASQNEAIRQAFPNVANLLYRPLGLTPPARGAR